MSGAPELNADFRDLLDSLRARSVEFLLVGAHAMAAHGVPRATGDLDLWVNPTEENARRVLEALALFGAPTRAHGVTTEDLVHPGFIYQLGLPPRRIDLLTELTGLSFAEAWRERKVVVVGGHPVPVLGREALLRNKRATARPKDLLDVALLEKGGS